MIVRVCEGETIETIARRYHTTADDIRERNRLEDIEVHHGMRLWVVGYLWHVWLPGDTLPNVCARYGVEEAAVRGANGDFAIGKRIKIPI